MKRKASTIDGVPPSKMKKMQTVLLCQPKEKTVTSAIGSRVDSMSGVSGRQRKTPSWLASYVTNSTQEKEVKKEKEIKKEKSKPSQSINLQNNIVTVKKLTSLKTKSADDVQNSTSLSPSLTVASSLKRKPSKKYTINISDNKKISVLSKDLKKIKKACNVSAAKTKVRKHEPSQRKISVNQKAVIKTPDIVYSVPASTKPDLQSCNTILLPDTTQRPNMLEVVICISTSGAMRDYLAVLQDRIREMIWRLQSLVPNLRIGVLAHTQGGIHDDQIRGSYGAGDHNYNRFGGHGGTKWLDLGATLSQICAFVDSLEEEPTSYPDYVQDNLEMALWKVQRCMSWSSSSYRTVIMIGRGRPNKTSFYHQKEHWRSWIRSALELKFNVEIPVIDWELEAKLLAEMGIHVFTIQGVADISDKSNEESEGLSFFRRVAEITKGQHIMTSDPSRLVEIILGICCACHGPELLLEHRDTVRDDNDGILPSQLTEVFVSLQLQSKISSLASLPSLLSNMKLASMRQQFANSQESMDVDELKDANKHRHSISMEVEEGDKVVLKNVNSVKIKSKDTQQSHKLKTSKTVLNKSQIKVNGTGGISRKVKRKGESLRLDGSAKSTSRKNGVESNGATKDDGRGSKKTNRNSKLSNEAEGSEKKKVKISDSSTSKSKVKEKNNNFKSSEQITRPKIRNSLTDRKKDLKVVKNVNKARLSLKEVKGRDSKSLNGKIKQKSSTKKSVQSGKVVVKSKSKEISVGRKVNLSKRPSLKSTPVQNGRKKIIDKTKKQKSPLKSKSVQNGKVVVKSKSKEISVDRKVNLSKRPSLKSTPVQNGRKKIIDKIKKHNLPLKSKMVRIAEATKKSVGDKNKRKSTDEQSLMRDKVKGQNHKAKTLCSRSGRIIKPKKMHEDMI